MIEKNIEEGLIDVRKSYRLLFLYQKRILNLIKFIGEYYDYRYNGGWSMFSNSSPKDSKGNLDDWSWDWINLYFYQFYFGKSDKELEFAIFHQADTGYFDSHEEVYFNDERKLNIESFKECEDSDSYLIFVVGFRKWQINTSWYKDEFLKRNKIEGKYEDDEGVLIFKKYKIANFWNEEIALKQLTDFTVFCKKNEIEFNSKQQ